MKVFSKRKVHEGRDSLTVGMNYFIIVTAEYAAPNPAAFDIANHFLEWTADYRTSTPHTLNAERYPTPDQRRNFYRAYLSPAQPVGLTPGGTTPSFGPMTSGLAALTPLSLSSSVTLTSSPPPISSSVSSVNAPSALRSKSSMASIALDEAPPDSESSGAVDAAQIDALEAEVRAWTPACLAQWIVWGIVQARDDILAGGVGEFDYLNYARGRVTVFREQLKLRGIHA